MPTCATGVARRTRGGPITVALLAAALVGGCTLGHAGRTPRLPELTATLARTAQERTARVHASISRPGEPDLEIDGTTSFDERRAVMTATAPGVPGAHAAVRLSPTGTFLRPPGATDWVPVDPGGELAAGAWISPLDWLARARTTRWLGPSHARGDPASRYAVAVGEDRPATVTVDGAGRLRRVVATEGATHSDVELFDFGVAVPDDP